MEILANGLLCQAEKGTSRAVLIRPFVISMSNGELLASWRCGSAKDSEDEFIELSWSGDGGRTWSKPQAIFGETRVNGVRGTLILAYFTEIEPSHLLAATLWVDREAYPGKPLFNHVTEGLLPIKILLADSFDFGRSWTPWRDAESPPDLGPPSLTNHILKLADGRLAMSIESNKDYEDTSKWMQKVAMLHSHDQGKTWSQPVVGSQDPTGRIFHWDQRINIAPDGRLVAFIWMYDSETHKYLNIRRRISSDGGRTWSPPADLGFADQPSRPAILPDGRVVLAWVDRFGTGSIRARLAESICAPFPAESEVCIYSHPMAKSAVQDNSTADSLVEMGRWSFGLPYAEALPGGDVLVIYYAGTIDQMNVYWTRLRV